MKKWIALLLAGLMVFAMTGCTGTLGDIELPPLPELTPTPAPTVQVSAESEAATEETPAPEGNAEQEASEPVSADSESRVLVSIGNTTLYNYDPAEGTELILTFAYDMPRVVAAENPEAMERINETLATQEELYYTGDNHTEGLSGYSDMLTAAEDNFAYVSQNEGSGLPLEFSSTRSARIGRVSETVLSLVFTDYVYTGGAHGMYGDEAWNFDMQTGEVLTLEKLSADYSVFSDFLVQSMLKLAEEDEDSYYSLRLAEGFVDSANLEEAFRGLLREGSWYFDREGLVFFSSLGEFGPYAAGLVEFHIPYADLEGRLDPQWLYTDSRNGEGSLRVCPMSELEGGSTEIVDKLIVNADGEELGLAVEGSIYDVVISTAYYSDGFFENKQLWAANTLSDCALQIQTVVPDGLPNLMIVYSTADGLRHTRLLSQSGENGDYLLVDDTIQAVG